ASAPNNSAARLARRLWRYLSQCNYPPRSDHDPDPRDHRGSRRRRSRPAPYRRRRRRRWRPTRRLRDLAQGEQAEGHVVGADRRVGVGPKRGGIMPSREEGESPRRSLLNREAKMNALSAARIESEERQGEACLLGGRRWRLKEDEGGNGGLWIDGL